MPIKTTERDFADAERNIDVNISNSPNVRYERHAPCY